MWQEFFFMPVALYFIPILLWKAVGLVWFGLVTPSYLPPSECQNSSPIEVCQLGFKVVVSRIAK